MIFSHARGVGSLSLWHQGGGHKVSARGNTHVHNRKMTTGPGASQYNINFLFKPAICHTDQAPVELGPSRGGPFRFKCFVFLSLFSFSILKIQTCKNQHVSWFLIAVWPLVLTSHRPLTLGSWPLTMGHDLWPRIVPFDQFLTLVHFSIPLKEGPLTFACKSSWQDWQDWYISHTGFHLHTCNKYLLCFLQHNTHTKLQNH